MTPKPQERPPSFSEIVKRTEMKQGIEMPISPEEMNRLNQEYGRAKREIRRKLVLSGIGAGNIHVVAA